MAHRCSLHPRPGTIICTWVVTAGRISAGVLATSVKEPGLAALLSDTVPVRQDEPDNGPADSQNQQQEQQKRGAAPATHPAPWPSPW